MMIEDGSSSREVIRLVRLGFDEHEQLISATFRVSPGAHTAILAVLPDATVLMDCDDGTFIGLEARLNVPDIRSLVEHFADPRTPKTPEADAIFNRMIALLGTFRRDLL